MIRFEMWEPKNGKLNRLTAEKVSKSECRMFSMIESMWNERIVDRNYENTDSFET